VTPIGVGAPSDLTRRAANWLMQRVQVGIRTGTLRQEDGQPAPPAGPDNNPPRRNAI